MTDFLEVARALEMVREDRKWYANVEAVRNALVEADRLAYERGVNDGLTGKRERAVGIVDEYAPPVGPVAVCNEDTAQDAACAFVAAQPFRVADLLLEAKRDPMYAAFYRRGSSSLGYIARDYFPSPSVPQPDGDGRFPEEAE